MNCMDSRPNGSAPRGQASIPVPPPVPIPKRPPRACPWAVGAFLLAAALLTGLVGIWLGTPMKRAVVEVNAPYPANQQQAKFMILSAWELQQVPNAARWCDALNASPQDWPGVPSNTVFALNVQAAGHALTTLPRDLVVFFETPKPGWNRAGGSELLARNENGVAVAFADGRALLVPPGQVATLRWNP
jgi:hypothetical protein